MCALGEDRNSKEKKNLFFASNQAKKKLQNYRQKTSSHREVKKRTSGKRTLISFGGQRRLECNRFQVIHPSIHFEDKCDV